MREKIERDKAERAQRVSGISMDWGDPEGFGDSTGSRGPAGIHFGIPSLFPFQFAPVTSAPAPLTPQEPPAPREYDECRIQVGLGGIPGGFWGIPEDL